MKMIKASFKFILAGVAAAAVSTILIMVSCTRQGGVLPGAGEGLTFTASIDENLTKTTLNGLNVEWESGDCINVNGGVFSATPGNPATKATFKYVKGTVSEPPYKAFYPEELVDSHSGKIILPSTLTYREGRLNSPMYAESDNESLSFKNICGVLCFSLTGSGSVKSITIVANEPVSGPIIVFDSDGGFEPMGGDKQFQTITMDCGSGVELGSSAKNFYIPLPPLEYTPGMELTISGTNGKQIKKVTDNSVSVERNTLYTFEWEVDLAESAGPSPISDEEAYYDIAGATNFWRNSEVSLAELYYVSSPNWETLPTPDYEWFGKDKKDFRVTIPSEIGGEQWQGQNQFVIEHKMEASKLYDFCVTLHSTQSGTATVKLGHKTEHSGNFVFEDNEVNLTAGQDFIFKMPNISPKEDYEGIALIFDFGRIPGGADVEIKNICLQEHQAPRIMPEILPGVFTVGPGQDKTFGTDDDDKVNFLKGNLWWKESDNTWHIEDHQYDVPEKYDREHLGLFYYFADAEKSNYGTKDITTAGTHEAGLFEKYGAKDDEHEFYAENANWGVPYGKGHTLTYEELGYLLSFDKKKSQYLVDDDPGPEDEELATDYSNEIRAGRYKERVEVVGHIGMLLVPDDWDLTKKPLDKTSYSATEWAAAEADGAVFLPYVFGYASDGQVFILPSPEYYNEYLKMVEESKKENPGEKIPEYSELIQAYFYCSGIVNDDFVVLSNMLTGKEAVMVYWYNWDMMSPMRLVKYVK